MRFTWIPVTFILLNACGGGVRGDVGNACMAAGRSAANPALCSCVQQVANTHLSRSDQRRAASFFEDPQLAQDTRQSDNPQLESFWGRYRTFSSAAERVCR